MEGLIQSSSGEQAAWQAWCGGATSGVGGVAPILAGGPNWVPLPPPGLPPLCHLPFLIPLDWACVPASKVST